MDNPSFLRRHRALCPAPALCRGADRVPCGRQSVNDMALRLQDEILARIDREVRVFLNTPRLINQANKNAVELGMHDPFDLLAWKDHLLRQAGSYTYAGNIAAGNEQRQYSRHRRRGPHDLSGTKT